MTLDLSAMPVQIPSAPADAAGARARFFNSGNAFNVRMPRVPAQIFCDEMARARALGRPGLVACDQSDALGCGFPATTPLMLARYAAVPPGDRLAARFRATGVIWHVIDGGGIVETDGEQFGTSMGDVFLTTGEPGCVVSAVPNGALLWVVTNEPQLALDGLRPAHSDEAPLDLVHYPAAEIARQIERVNVASRDRDTAGIALIFSSARQEGSRNILPSLTLALNSLLPGEQQRAHRHNAAAITLILRGERCYSQVADGKCNWSDFATLVTPARDPHLHHNDGATRAFFLIVRDGGLHYHARTMGFTFLGDA